MAFQAPVVNIASVTADLWPSIKSTLAAPWRTITQGQGRRLISSQHERSASPLVRSNGSKAISASDSPIDLPDFLAITPAAVLRSSHPLQNVRRGHDIPPSLIPSPHILQAANPFHSRTISASPSYRLYSTLAPFRLTPKFYPVRTSFTNIPRRSFTSGSGNSSQNLLAHMEQTANNNPTSGSAQNAFYSALLRADMPNIVVERFQTGRYSSNDACETTYRRALEKLARAEGAGALGAGAQGTTASNFSEDQLRNIASSIAARTKGNGAVAGAKIGSRGTGDKASPLYVVVEESTAAAFFKWVKFILYFGLIGYFALVFMTVAVETSGVLRKVGATNSTEAQPEKQNVRFSDVHGCEEAKEELQELVEFLKNPDKFSSLGGKLPKGVLLVGPPGTGKTLLARAVAGEAGVPFFYMSGSEFDEIYVGVGAKRVRELFTNARAKAPAIIFIDELDAIGGKRNERDPTYVKQSLNQLLTELDGFSQDTGVIILAATNFPKLLDKALTRPGRFDRNVTVPLPDVRGRMEIIKHHMKNMKIDADVDESVIARGTSGFSGAELESLVNQAAVRASKNKATKINMLDMDWAKDKIMMGAERRSAVIKEEDKLKTAYHEAGHALVGIYTQGATPIYKATIMPRGQTLGVTHFMPDMDKVSDSRREHFAQIDVSMGGKAAEQIVYGEDETSSGCSSDISQATNTAWAMVTQYGMSPLGNINLTNSRDLSPQTRSAVETEMRKMIDEGHARARSLLEARRKELDTLATALVEHEVLSLEEMKKVIRGEKLPNKLKATGRGVGGIKLPEIVMPPGMTPSGSRVGEGTASEAKRESEIS